jgi:hydroxymethylpyrimidine pyrophosphatase-like HAD family hydrolase
MVEVRYHVLACDYDGTIARHGHVDEATLDALRRLAATGRKLVLVTGRQLDDLRSVFPETGVFDRIVAENGAVVHDPSTRRTRTLGAEPPAAFVAELARRGVQPLSVGRVIVATWQPHEAVVLNTIRDLGLELQVIFNKGAVMVLASGLNKGTGLLAALDDLKLSPHNCVGVGDAENDHAFLDACECAVAVANALPGLKEKADLLTRGDHGEGVVELVERLIEDDLRSAEDDLARHDVPLGESETGPFALRPYGSVVLIAGPSGEGKSYAAAAIVERLIERRYQVCLIDPEGDYDGFEGLTAVGSPTHAPDVEHVMQALARPDQHVVINLLGVAMPDRPGDFARVLGRLHELRVVAGRPHWIVVDEAHHVLHASFDPASRSLLQDLISILVVTIDPARLHPLVLRRTGVVIAVGNHKTATIEAFARAAGRPAPAHANEDERALVWRVDSPTTERVTLLAPHSERRRHRRKYAEGELGPDKSFYFRGPSGKLNLRAQNLLAFNQMAEGVDDETWLFHLRNGDVAWWLSDAVKDEELAGLARDVAVSELSAAETRTRIRNAIEERYTLGG